MKQTIPIIMLLMSISGCASMTNGSTQDIKIKTINDFAKNTVCMAHNEEGQWDNIAPWQTITIDRDGNPLHVECSNATQSGVVSSDPEFQTRFLLLDLILVDACILSCFIDGNNNAFYEYPHMITVPMKNK